MKFDETLTGVYTEESFMGEYKDQKSGAAVALAGEKFAFPTSGAKILLKSRPPIAKEVPTD
jgi:hypothetical protein